MRSKKKKTYHHGSLRRAMIDAAIKTIAERGIDALNLRQLAARAGVSAGAPYHHFASREELLTAIAAEGFERLAADLAAAQPPSPGSDPGMIRGAAPSDPGARLEALGQAYIRFAIADPGSFRVMFHGDAAASGPTAPGLRAFRLLRDCVVACQEAGLAPPGDPQPLVLTAWSAVHGFATLWVDRALPFEGMDPERLAPEIGRTVARMFAAMAKRSVDA
jgi:AcrR family transcriptional regulator